METLEILASRQPLADFRGPVYPGDYWTQYHRILTIFLPEEGSAESKPPEASDQETGEANKRNVPTRQEC